MVDDVDVVEVAVVTVPAEVLVAVLVTSLIVVCVAGSTQATTTANSTQTGERRRIVGPLWHVLAVTSRNLVHMFGPLNGVRTALVIAAGVAALISLILGYPAAAAILGVGIAVHGLGWLYLYHDRDRVRIKTD